MGHEGMAAAREQAKGRDPFETARAAGAEYAGAAEEGVFRVPFLGSVAEVSFPAFESLASPPPPPHILALLVYYLAWSDGSEPTGEWTSFADFPDGGFYVQAFRGYSSDALVRSFGDDLDALNSAVQRVGAQPLADYADHAWLVPALPRVPIALLWWDGDDEFETRADMLFDSTATRHLPIDGLAVLGGWLAKTLSSGRD